MANCQVVLVIVVAIVIESKRRHLGIKMIVTVVVVWIYLGLHTNQWILVAMADVRQHQKIELEVDLKDK